MCHLSAMAACLFTFGLRMSIELIHAQCFRPIVFKVCLGSIKCVSDLWVFCFFPCVSCKFFIYLSK